jgi:hypothetical protein
MGSKNARSSLAVGSACEPAAIVIVLFCANASRNSRSCIAACDSPGFDAH